eukprot:728240-Hanusia_phi.AAC.2
MNQAHEIENERGGGRRGKREGEMVGKPIELQENRGPDAGSLIVKEKGNKERRLGGRGGGEVGGEGEGQDDEEETKDRRRRRRRSRRRRRRRRRGRGRKRGAGRGGGEEVGEGGGEEKEKEEIGYRRITKIQRL